ncbi:MAG: hypothetical protein IJY27_02790 [Clostridia bacterium]|nr:hypothetical protein [Clostridia bacterium]
MNKNIIRVAALAMVVIMLAATLASCGGLSGTYKGTGVEYTFKGNKVSIQVNVFGADIGDPIEGTYKISGDKITITLDKDSEYAGTFDFEKDGDVIKIGAFKYEKK